MIQLLVLERGQKNSMNFLTAQKWVNVCKFPGRPETSSCFQEYRTTCLLGCETDTYDSEGARVRLAPWRHVTQQSVEANLPKFTGQINQLPPM